MRPTIAGFYWALVEPDAPAWEPVSVYFNNDGEMGVILMGSDEQFIGSDIDDMVLRFGEQLIK